jgi:hypothetical protein
MKSRIALSVVSVLITITAFASDAAVTQSDAQKSFDQLKTFAGTWEGHVTTVPPRADIEGKVAHASHHCDAGNRPRMTGKMSPDGKTVEFEFLDVAGSTRYGHMHHAVFTAIDPNHHTEDWTYMEPGDKLVHAHIELQRTK